MTRDLEPRDIDEILRINAGSLSGVSLLSPEYLENLVRQCAQFRIIEAGEQVAGYLCALNRSAVYDGDEFQWFQEHIRENFLYIDQVAVSRPYRGNGLGRALYDDLEKYAQHEGIDTLVCEVNYDPVNIESQVFHRQRGFAEVGRMETRGVLVSLMAKRGFT